MIKNSETQLFRISIVEGVSECFYIRVKKSDLDKRDIVTEIKNSFYLGSNEVKEKMMTFSDTIDNGYLDVCECDDEELEGVFETDDEDCYTHPNIFLTFSSDGKSTKIQELLLETPITSYDS